MASRIRPTAHYVARMMRLYIICLSPLASMRGSFGTVSYVLLIGSGSCLPRGALAAWWMHARGQVPMDSRKGFDSAILLVSLMLWKERNSHVFDNATCTAALTARRVLDEGDAWLAAGFTALCLHGGRGGAVGYSAS